MEHFEEESRREAFEEAFSEEVTLNPWTSVWLQPRATMRNVLDRGATQDCIYIYVLSVAIWTIMGIEPSHEGEMLRLVLAAFLGGMCSGLMSYLIHPYLLYLPGKVLGGTATVSTIRYSLGIGSIPVLWTIPLHVLFITLFGHRVFMDVPESEMVLSDVLIFFYWIINTVVAFWTCITLLKTFAEVESFSFWRSVLTQILAFVMVFCVIFSLFFIAAYLRTLG